MVYFYSLQKNFKEDSPYKEIEDLVAVRDLLLKESIVAIDCETTGLNPHTSNVTMFQFGTATDQYVIDTRGLETFATIFKPLLENKDITFVGHNLKFDYNMLKQFGIVLHNIYDTMLAERVIYNGKYTPIEAMRMRRYSLAGVYKHYFDKDLPKTVRTEFTWWGDKAFTEEQIMYGAKDVIHPLEIKEKQSFWIEKLKLKKCNSLEFKSVLAVGDIEYNGFYIDPVRWLKAAKAHALQFKEVRKELDIILIKDAPRYEQKAVQLSLFGEVVRERYTDINWDSSAQVKDVLKKVYKLRPLNKEGKHSTETKALIRLVDPPEIVTALVEYRAHGKIVSSFGETFIEKNLHKDQRIRANFNQMVDTGRMSSNKPNMQQIPRGAEFRSAFIAPPGKLVVTADYANQEGRIMADHSRDEDYFIVTADNENSSYRQKGKVLNFMISFGGSAYTLAKELKISTEEAEGLIDSFYKGFPGLKRMFDKSKAEAVANGYVRTNDVTNRLRWIPEWNTYNKYNGIHSSKLTKEERSLKGKAKGRIERKGMNTGIQGTAGDMTKTSLIIIRNKLLELGIRPTIDANIKVVQVVHDEIVMEATKGYENLAATILSESMEKAGSYFVQDVQMKAAPVIGSVWDH